MKNLKYFEELNKILKIFKIGDVVKFINYPYYKSEIFTLEEAIEFITL